MYQGNGTDTATANGHQGKRNQMSRVLGLFLTLFLLLSCVAFCCVSAASTGFWQIPTQTTETHKVLDKQIMQVGSSRTQSYLVFTDKETLVVADVPWKLQFDSADIWGRRLKVGQCYQFTLVGWRIPAWSAMRTIVAYPEVPCSDTK